MDDSFIIFKYQFESGTGPWEESRYIREFKMGIFSQNEYGDQIKSIGKVEFKIVYVGEAIKNGYGLYEIFDTFEYTFRHAQEFFDFDTNEIKEDIQKYYDYELFNSNICLLERIEILPEFRGCKIAAKATKDIIGLSQNHLKTQCYALLLPGYSHVRVRLYNLYILKFKTHVDPVTQRLCR